MNPFLILLALVAGFALSWFLVVRKVSRDVPYTRTVTDEEPIVAGAGVAAAAGAVGLAGAGVAGAAHAFAPQADAHAFAPQADGHAFAPQADGHAVVEADAPGSRFVVADSSVAHGDAALAYSDTSDAHADASVDADVTQVAASVQDDWVARLDAASGELSGRLPTVDAPAAHLDAPTLEVVAPEVDVVPSDVVVPADVAVPSAGLAGAGVAGAGLAAAHLAHDDVDVTQVSSYVPLDYANAASDDWSAAAVDETIPARAYVGSDASEVDLDATTVAPVAVAADADDVDLDATAVAPVALAADAHDVDLDATTVAPVALAAAALAPSIETPSDGRVPEGYTVKGDRKAKLYLLPDDRDFARARADMWFVDESAAVDAGYAHYVRKPKVAQPAVSHTQATLVDIPVVQAEPYGPGSAAAFSDGSGPEGWTIKGNADSMLFHTTDSPWYARTKAEVWFNEEDTARAAGFTKWNERDKTEPATLVQAEIIEDGGYGIGSAKPKPDGTGPTGWTIKGNADSMLFHTTDSPWYARTKAEVWFETEDKARQSGFTRWNER